MANRFIIQSGGATSGDCSTFGTAGTLAYVTSETGPVVAGDDVYWCAGAAGASYDITSATQLLVRFQATGTAGAPINVYGCNSSGVRDGTRPEVKATGTWSTAISYFVIGTDAAAAPLRYVNWYDIDWNANSSSGTTGSYNVINNSGVLTTGAGTNTTAYYHTFTRCRFRNSKHNGVSLFTGGVGTEVDRSFTFTQCDISGCGVTATGYAAIGRSANAATWVMDRCDISGNQIGMNIAGVDTTRWFTAINCTFRDSVNGPGFIIPSMIADFYGCTFSGNATYGLQIAYNAGHKIERCRFLNNTISGVNETTWDGTAAVSPYNRNAYLNPSADNFYADALISAITPPGTSNVFATNFPPRRGAERR